MINGISFCGLMPTMGCTKNQQCSDKKVEPGGKDVRLAAIIVNYNGGEIAVAAVRSLLAQSMRLKIWVIDNASTDGSLKQISELNQSIRIVHNKENLGYAAANNQALRELCDQDYVLLLNNDVLFPESNALESVVAEMETNSAIKAACGRFEYPDGRYQHFYNRLPRPIDMALNWGALCHIEPLIGMKIRNHFHYADMDPSKPQDLEQPAFACVLLRGACLREVGLFDERFPILFNDVDYCWRWRQQGWTWRYLPDWRVVHHHGMSVRRIGPLLAVDRTSSALRFARKHFSVPVAFCVVASIIAEAAYRKYRYGEYPVSLWDLWKGKLFFCDPQDPTVRS